MTCALGISFCGHIDMGKHSLQLNSRLWTLVTVEKNAMGGASRELSLFHQAMALNNFRQRVFVAAKNNPIKAIQPIAALRLIFFVNENVKKYIKA